jgi:hypothetical protein
MDPLGWGICGICAEKSRLPDRSTLSRPGTAGVYWGHRGYISLVSKSPANVIPIRIVQIT